MVGCHGFLEGSGPVAAGGDGHLVFLLGRDPSMAPSVNRTPVSLIFSQMACLVAGVEALTSTYSWPFRRWSLISSQTPMVKVEGTAAKTTSAQSTRSLESSTRVTWASSARLWTSFPMTSWFCMASWALMPRMPSPYNPCAMLNAASPKPINPIFISISSRITDSLVFSLQLYDTGFYQQSKTVIIWNIDKFSL